MATSSQTVVGDVRLAGMLEKEHLPAGGALADVVAKLEERYAAKFYRTTLADGTVRAQFEVNESSDSFEVGDRFAAQGASTVEAVEKLRTRMETIINANA